MSNPLEESRLPTHSPQSMIYTPCIGDRTPLKIGSATNVVPQEYHEEDKTLQELPPNHAPLPEIASSDPPQPCHELPSSDRAIQTHARPKDLQPSRPGFRPYSPSRLSVVSSFHSSPPLARAVSPVSVTNDDISADVR